MKRIPEFQMVRLLILSILTSLLFSGAVFADEAPIVVEQNRRFVPAAIEVQKGDVLEVHNEDEFFHQIFSRSPGMSLDTDERAPGSITLVEFPGPGTFKVQCHIHPKMQLEVTVVDPDAAPLASSSPVQ